MNKFLKYSAIAFVGLSAFGLFNEYTSGRMGATLAQAKAARIEQEQAAVATAAAEREANMPHVIKMVCKEGILNMLHDPDSAEFDSIHQWGVERDEDTIVVYPTLRARNGNDVLFKCAPGAVDPSIPAVLDIYMHEENAAQIVAPTHNFQAA